MTDHARATGERRLLYRVVDHASQGWYPTSEGSGGIVYTALYGATGDLAARSFEQLAADRGPLRPVEPVTAVDVAALHRLFGEAGRKAITTLAAALETVFHEIREEQGGLETGHDSFEFAQRTMIAGRPGSWESELLLAVVMFGNELNLAPAKGSARYDVDARRAAGPGKRVDTQARAGMVAILRRWVTDPGRYTEVAETLAGIVSSYCDGQPDGWRAVADQWLQPGGLAQENFSLCYRLFYSRSERFDTAVI
jgi:hypothetical protein